MAEHDANREPQPIDEEAAWAAIVAGYGEEPADPPGAKPFKSVEDLALLEGERNGKDPRTEAVPEPPGPLKPPAAPSGAGAPEAGTDPGSGTDMGTSTGSGTGTSAGPGTGTGSGTGTASGAAAGKAGEGGAGERTADGGAEEPEAGRPTLGGSITFAPGVGGPGIAVPGGGPRDYRLAEPEDGDGATDDDEGHFVPPEPPPLPESDVTARFAWLAVIGGPVLMLIAVLLSWDMTWWLTTICVGGFLGGFATLVARMDPDDDESDDPGRGAVV
ncbi:hypothetical protein AB0P17_01880 [Streptomyces sp. NPDC088124]|uniref:hypothetical protein n=1 Tax=Streptomyces sp. NPDC088124 TaxID=3154654 RepID=UPI00341508A4